VKALVTGARGFVGPYLVAHLAASGDDITELTGDVLDADSVHEQIAAAAPDVVYHLAALSHVGESWKDPNRAFRVNAEGTLNVLRAAGAAHNAVRVVVIGSAEEYGRVTPDQVPIDEDTPLRPVTPYGSAKVAAEYLALQAHLGAGLDTVRVRAFNHTGPGQDPRFVVAGMAHRIRAAIADGHDHIKVGNLDAVRDYTDVRDVVRAYRLLAEHGAAGEAYNVCSGIGTAVHEIVATYLTFIDRGIALEPDPALLRPSDLPVLIGDNTRLCTATGWTPEIPLEQMLRDVYDAAEPERG